MKRVLVARMDSMGDVLLSGPAVRAIATAAEVVLLAGPQGAGAARLLPGVSAVRVLAVPWITPTERPVNGALTAAIMALVAETGIDEAVVLTSFHQSPLPLALLLRLAGVTRIVGASIDAAGGLLDTRLIPGEDFDEDLPEPVRALRIAEAAGYALPPDDAGALAVDLRPGRPSMIGDGPYVVVHPGAAVPARAYPAEQCAQVVELLAGRGHRVVVTGGPDERPLTAAVAGTAGLDVGGALDLASLGATLRDARAVIVGNTGPAHLAAATGTAVVSLFAPVVPPARWAPWGVRVELLGDQTAACRGSRARICPVAGHPCLASVSPQSVVDAAERLMGSAA